MRNKGNTLAALAVTLLVGIPTLAADTVIRRGIDVFTTTFDGTTHYSFANNPIPAGFFCEKSAAFTGNLALKGLPLATGDPERFGDADTVVERLDDAVFNAKGIAVTRIQFRALSLVSIAPIKTACGAFHVYVSLADKQRVTKMSIFRTEENGGTFIGPLAVNMRMTFIPVEPPRNKSSRKLELTGSVTFPGRPMPWSLHGPSTKQLTSLVVDTNGDQTPDTLLFGTSNFWPGRRPQRASTGSKIGGGGGGGEEGCFFCATQCSHYVESEEHDHCTGFWVCPPESYCY